MTHIPLLLAVKREVAELEAIANRIARTVDTLLARERNALFDASLMRQAIRESRRVNARKETA